MFNNIYIVRFKSLYKNRRFLLLVDGVWTFVLPLHSKKKRSRDSVWRKKSRNYRNCGTSRLASRPQVFCFVDKLRRSLDLLFSSIPVTGFCGCYCGILRAAQQCITWLNARTRPSRRLRKTQLVAASQSCQPCVNATRSTDDNIIRRDN